MSAPDAPAVDVELKPSHRAHQFLFWVHVVPLVLLPLTMETGTAMLIIAAGIAVSWFWLRRHPVFGFGPRAVIRVHAHGDGRWSIENPARKPAEAELLGNSYVHPRLLILNFRLPSGQSRTRIILGDEAPEDVLRRLRARLSALGASHLDKN